MAYTDEQLMKEYNDRLYKRNIGTDIGYGADSGKDADTTLSYLNKQSEADSSWEKIGKSFYNGLIAYTGRGIISSLQMIRDYNIASRQEQDPNYTPNTEATSILDDLAKKSIFQPYAVQADSAAGQFGLDLVAGAGQLLGQIGTSVAFGGVGGALAKAGAVTAGKLAAKTGTSLVLGAQIAGNQYADLRKQGVDVKRAAHASTANALVQSQLERVSLEKMIKVMPSSMKAKSRQILENAATEGLTEFLQQYPEALSEIYAKGAGKTTREMAAEFDEKAGEITQEGLYNAAIGFILGGSASTINVAINGVDEAVQQEVQKAKIGDMQQRLQDHEKSGINADYIRGVVNTNLPEEKVSIDGEVLWGYAQSKNADEIAKSLGVTAEEIKKAAEDGLDIEIRQGDFEATALINKDFMQQVENDISFGDGYTLNRGRLKKEYIRQMEKAKDEELELQTWKDEKISELRKAGMNKQEALSAITLLTSAARAARPDNPMEFMREYPLRFERMVRTPKGSYPQYSQSAISDKQKQLDIILKTNPMQDDYHVGVRELNDIFSGDEVFSEKNFEELNPDFTADMAKQAIESGFITVYSSKPIELGGFVSSSKMMAKDYAGSGKIYSQKVPINDIAWIDETEGQYAPAKEYENIFKQGERGQIGWDKEGQAIIRMFENADASTFIHEAMGHYLANVLAKEAAKPNANPQIIKDFETLLKYAGTTKEQWDYLTSKRRYGPNLTLNQTAYHGTPHKFEEFDLGAIGTGEGAQAHGWGLYFAKDINVAQAYKDVLGADKTIIQTTNTSYLQNEDGDWVDGNTNNVIEYGSALSYALEALDTGKTKEKAIKDLEAEIEKRKDKNTQAAKSFIAAAKESIDILNNEQFNVVNNSRILEVDIPDDKFLLDEQKNYFEQPEEVKTSLAKAGFAPVYYETREWVRNEYGANAVKELDGIFKPLANGVAGLSSVNKKILLDKYGIDEETSQYMSRELTQYSVGIYSATGEHLSINSGRGIYQYFTDLYASDRAASLHLNKNGVKGITYEGITDGRCFVVFDDKAIEVINTYNQAAGPNARTANLQKLEEAQRLAASRINREEIYARTGWYKGADGKWRFDIPDFLPRSNIRKLEVPAKNEIMLQGTIADIYPNSELFNAYPFIKDIEVYVVNNDDSYFGYVKGNKIFLNAKSLGEFKDYESQNRASKTLIHEIQHIIQDYEGFAHGGTVKNVRKNINKQIAALKNEAESFDNATKSWWKLEQAAEESYFSDVSEEEANQLQNKADTFAEQNNISQDSQDQYRDIAYQIERLEKALNEKDDYRLYQSLYGEIEARNASDKAEIRDNIRREENKAVSYRYAAANVYIDLSEELKKTADEYKSVTEAIHNMTNNQDEETYFEKQYELAEILNADSAGEKFVAALDDMYWSLGTVKELEQDYMGAILRGSADSLENIYVYQKDIESRSENVPGDMLTEAEDAELVRIQEAWATAAEQYFLEGRAPSKELQGVFRRFKKWLTDIYQTIDNFIKTNEYAIPISDEVRQVFDRMLASEADIRNMERVNGYFAKLPAVITENMSEATKRKIQDFTEKARDKAIDLLTKKSLENFSQERKERIASYRADILPDVEKEVRETPLYSAIASVEESVSTYKTAKTIAKKYLTDEGRVYSSWTEELNDVRSDISDRLEPIMIMLREGMDRRKSKDGSESNNIWYKVWYKEHKRMPSEKDLKQLAYEIYMGQRTDVLPEYNIYGTDAKEELQELMEREKEILQYKDQVSKYKHRGLLENERMAFEMIAEKYGYGSGEDLANNIIESPTVQQAITARADELVQQAFPDIYKERALAEEATKEALYNDDSGLVLGLELQLVEDYAATGLARQRDIETNQKIAAARWQQAVAGAKRELGEMQVADAIRTSRYISAERKAAVQAATAMANKEFGEALRYKNQQALLHAMVQESLRMRTEVIKWRKYINRQFTVRKETWVSDTHFNQAAALMLRMGYKRKDYDPFRREQSIAQYIEEMQQQFPEAVAIAPWIVDEHVMLNNPMQMTYSQFEDIVEALQNIKALAKAEEGKNIMGSKETYLEFTMKMLEKLNELETVWTPKSGETQKATAIEKMRAALRNIDNFFEMMDKWKYGFFSKHFGGIIKQCNDREAEKMLIYRTKLAEAHKAWLPDKNAEMEADRKIKYDDLGGACVDKHVLVRMLMNLGNEGNARVLCTTPPEDMKKSHLWVYPEGNITRYDAIQQTKENLLAFLGEHLTERDIAYAQDIINIAGMNWEEMAAMEKRTKGFAPPKVEALPVLITLADGQEIIFKGGYFPLIRDTQTGNKPQGKEIIDVTDGDSDQGRNIRTLFTGNGNLKERVNAEYQIDLRRGAEFNAIINGIHDLCWREAMSDFRRIFNDENMFYSLKTKLGLANMRAFREMLEKAANPLGVGSDTLGESLVGNAANWLRRKTVNFAIMGNMKTAVQNLGNLWLYGNAVEGFGYKDVFTAVVRAHQNYDKSGDYKSLKEFVNAKSIFMRERTEVPDITLRDMQGMNDLNKVERATMKWGAKFMAATDNITARPVWAEAYSKKINEGASDKEAVDFADMVIRRTLGSSRITDVSSMQRGGSLFKLFTMFQGFFNTQYNQWERTYGISKRSYQEGRYGDMMMNITSFAAAKWFFTCLTALLLAGENPFGDEEDDENKLAKELIHYPISMLGPVGTIINAMLDNMLGFKNYGYRVTAADSALQTFMRTAGKVNKVAEGEAEWTEILEPATTAASYYFGIPGQINKLFWNAYDVLYGDMEPEFKDLFQRRPKNER